MPEIPQFRDKRASTDFTEEDKQNLVSLLTRQISDQDDDVAKSQKESKRRRFDKRKLRWLETRVSKKLNQIEARGVYRFGDWEVLAHFTQFFDRMIEARVNADPVAGVLLRNLLKELVTTSQAATSTYDRLLEIPMVSDAFKQTKIEEMIHLVNKEQEQTKIKTQSLHSLTANTFLHRTLLNMDTEIDQYFDNVRDLARLGYSLPQIAADVKEAKQTLETRLSKFTADVFCYVSRYNLKITHVDTNSYFCKQPDW